MKHLLLSLALLSALPTWAATQLSNVVCFVRFSDENAADDTWDHDRAYYDTMMNDATDGANSVYSYYRDASFGALEWKSTIIASDYVDSHARAYYQPKSSINNINNIGYGSGVFGSIEASSREQAMIKELAAYLETILPQDAVIDGNNDGTVDNLTIILYGNSDISSSRLLWPHNNKMQWAAASIHGKKVSNYLVVFDSRNGGSISSPKSINTGVLCHEMMHTLNAYDLYNDGDDLVPVGTWDLMSENQLKPQGMTAYVRATYGKAYGDWIPEIKQLTESGQYTLAPMDSKTPDNVAYKIQPDRNRAEYFMVEYRRKQGWDSSLPSEGILVYRLTPGYEGNTGARNKYELYMFRPGGTLDADGQLSKAPLGPATGRLSFGADGDADYPFYSDGVRADFSITDVKAMDGGMSFMLHLGQSGIDDVTGNEAILYYDASSHSVIAPEASTLVIYNHAGQRIDDLPSAPAGIYIAKAIYPSGASKVIKFRK